MNINIKKYLTYENIITFLFVLYLFFLSKKGGDSKYRVGFALSILGFIQFYKNKFNINDKILKLSFISGVLYTVFISVIYYFTEDKNNKLEYFLSISYFSIIFSIFISQLKIGDNLKKYLPIGIVLMTLPGMYYGIKDAIKWHHTLHYYRINGANYTTIYAGEVGLYLIIGIIFLFFCKKWYSKLFISLYIFTNGLLIYFCKSRNATITIFLALVVLLFIRYLNNIKKAILYSILLITLLFVGISLAKDSKYISRIGNLTSIEKIKKDKRTPIYIHGTEKIKENIIKGEGFYPYLNKGYHVKETGEKIPHFHNNFLELCISHGVFTTFFYCIYFILITIYFVKNIVTNKLYSYLALGGIIFYQAYGLFDSSIYMTKFTDLTFLLITLGIINTRKENLN